MELNSFDDLDLKVKNCYTSKREPASDFLCHAFELIIQKSCLICHVVKSTLYP